LKKLLAVKPLSEFVDDDDNEQQQQQQQRSDNTVKPLINDLVDNAALSDDEDDDDAKAMLLMNMPGGVPAADAAAATVALHDGKTAVLTTKKQEPLVLDVNSVDSPVRQQQQQPESKQQQSVVSVPVSPVSPASAASSAPDVVAAAEKTSRFFKKHFGIEAPVSRLRRPPVAFLRDLVKALVEQTGTSVFELHLPLAVLEHPLSTKIERLAFLSQLIECAHYESMSTALQAELKLNAGKMLAGKDAASTNAMLLRLGEHVVSLSLDGL
jgi:hypothetical protein